MTIGFGLGGAAQPRTTPWLQPSRCRVLFQFHRRCLLPLDRGGWRRNAAYSFPAYGIFALAYQGTIFRLGLSKSLGDNDKCLCPNYHKSPVVMMSAGEEDEIDRFCYAKPMRQPARQGQQVSERVCGLA